MAYLRGDYYIWDDTSGFHFWAKDGYDGWNQAWASDESGENRAPGYENASGVSVPADIIDAFVMVRLAHLIHEGKVTESIDRATSQLGGNIGAMLLGRNAEKLKEVLTSVQLQEAD